MQTTMLAAVLLLVAAEDWTDWTDLEEWEPNPGWRLEDGTIARAGGGGTLWSRAELGDFSLRLEFKLPPGGNSGILFRSRDNVEHEIELLADAGRPPRASSSGSVFRRYAPSKNMARPPGEWNVMELEVRGRAVTVTYNGERVIENAIVDDLPFRGPVGLQDHGTPLWFRNIRVRRLDAPRAGWTGDPGPDLSAEETRAFMRELVDYVRENHLKKDPASAQRGMVYEYFDTGRKGELGQWVQGEALDTMHDGAWFAAALVDAARATGEEVYARLLREWVLPFYLKMLNHSDELFSPDRDDSGGRHPFGRSHLLQEGEKGFVPYWWDDGASVSLERERERTGKPPYPCRDNLAGKPNPEMVLDGYSLGCSNHMAQDLAVMLEQAWLFFRERDPALAAEVAEAARNLHESRLRHHGSIPMVAAAAALAGRDRELMERVPGPGSAVVPSNHATDCLAPRDPERVEPTPGFADDDEYRFYTAIARTGGELPRELAFRLVYNAVTHPLLFRYWADDAEVPPGMNRFDLYGLSYEGGKPSSYRSDRDVPLGSRFGPQNMVVCGWALQALEAFPGLWDEHPVEGVRVGFLDEGKSFRVDGKPEPGASEEIALGDAALRLVSQRSALLVRGRAKGREVAVRVGPATVTLRADRTWEASGGLRAHAHIVPNEAGFHFELALPYTVAKDQARWANPVEFFPLEVAVGEAKRKFTLARSEAQVRAALHRELAQGLRTWRKVFRDFGYIPTSIHRGGRWDRLSDSGGYAHLLSAASQYLLLLEGRRAWEAHRVPRWEQ